MKTKTVEETLREFMQFCKDIDIVWAKEFEAWIPEYLEKNPELNAQQFRPTLPSLSDEEIEKMLFDKIGARNTMTEKEYLIGMIIGKMVRDHLNQSPVVGEGWVSVEERKPEKEDADENGKVLIYRQTNDGQKGMTKTIYDYYIVKHCDNKTFWCKLPPPPTK